jgi:hypothetical protein
MNTSLGKKMENRYNARVPFHVNALVAIKEKIIDGEVENLSTGGMFFKTTDDLSLNEPVTVTIILYGASSHLALDIAGKVIRKSDTGVAIQFTELDLDSFIHLRNIISHNTPDSKIIKEFHDAKTWEEFNE